MMLLPMMKKRGLSLIGLLRGLTYGTDFTEGADSQVLYSVLDSYTTTGSNAVRGSTSGSDGNDPTWGNDGASYYGPYRYFSDIPYTGIIDYIDTTTTWSMHQRIYFPTGAIHTFLNTYGASKGSIINMLSGKIVFVNNNNGFDQVTYSATCISAGASSAWYTVSMTCSNADGIKVYVNGSQTGSFAMVTTTAQSSPSTYTHIGISPAAGTGTSYGVKTRAFAVCNVTHSDAEVAAIHAKMATLPNAA